MQTCIDLWKNGQDPHGSNLFLHLSQSFYLTSNSIVSQLRKAELEAECVWFQPWKMVFLTNVFSMGQMVHLDFFGCSKILKHPAANIMKYANRCTCEWTASNNILYQNNNGLTLQHPLLWITRDPKCKTFPHAFEMSTVSPLLFSRNCQCQCQSPNHAIEQSMFQMVLKAWLSVLEPHSWPFWDRIIFMAHWREGVEKVEKDTHFYTHWNALQRWSKCRKLTQEYQESKFTKWVTLSDRMNHLRRKWSRIQWTKLKFVTSLLIHFQRIVRCRRGKTLQMWEICRNVAIPHVQHQCVIYLKWRQVIVAATKYRVEHSLYKWKILRKRVQAHQLAIRDKWNQVLTQSIEYRHLHIYPKWQTIRIFFSLVLSWKRVQSRALRKQRVRSNWQRVIQRVRKNIRYQRRDAIFKQWKKQQRSRMRTKVRKARKIEKMIEEEETYALTLVAQQALFFRMALEIEAIRSGYALLSLTLPRLAEIIYDDTSQSTKDDCRGNRKHSKLDQKALQYYTEECANYLSHVEAFLSIRCYDDWIPLVMTRGKKILSCSFPIYFFECYKQLRHPWFIWLVHIANCVKRFQSALKRLKEDINFPSDVLFGDAIMDVPPSVKENWLNETSIFAYCILMSPDLVSDIVQQCVNVKNIFTVLKVLSGATLSMLVNNPIMACKYKNLIPRLESETGGKACAFAAIRLFEEEHDIQEIKK